jgi:8-oxo-dGTP pyrophosphatase MutT (NUDIX family)
MSTVRPATEGTLDAGSVVWAAGGLIMRKVGPDRWQVAVVHRPHRVDWSFPKGKVEPDETFEECALREVREETGLACRLGSFVGHTEYRDRKSRSKVVAYWVMYVDGGTFSPTSEVDDLVWLTFDEAVGLLTYERDRELLTAAADVVNAAA